LVALANTPEGRALIHGAISENRNDSGEVSSYTVKLFRPALIPPGTFTPVAVTVSAEYARGHAKPREVDGQYEIWSLVIEKAYAVLKGGYNRIGHGGIPVYAMEALTGRPCTRINLALDGAPSYRGDGTAPVPGKRYSAEDLKRDLAANMAIAVETPDWLHASQEEYRLLSNHAYAVIGFAEDNEGRLFLKLKNPWNRPGDEPDLVPFEELAKWFTAIDIVDAK
jgi:hypothetical protein